MINRILSLFEGVRAGKTASGGEGEEVRMAAAALLVEAALLDGHFQAAERQVIKTLLKERFELSEEEAEYLIHEGAKAAGESSQLYAFTRVLKDRFSFEERIGMIEMLWEVAYADGVLHNFEASLMRRIAGLLYVADRDSGLARQRVLRRLGVGG